MSAFWSASNFVAPSQLIETLETILYSPLFYNIVIKKRITSYVTR